MVVAAAIWAALASNLLTYTLPTAPGSLGNLGSILFVQEPALQQTLEQIFGSQLRAPTNPPPIDTAGQTPGWVPSTTTTTVKAATSSVVIPSTGASFLVNLAASTSTITTVAPEGDQYFDPTPCTPK